MDERGYRAVVGHADVIENLQNAVRTDRVSHAYLFAGAPGAGKRLLATLFAMTLLCREGGAEPCFHCPSCRKIQSMNHPDLIFLHPEKPGLISVEDIRSQVVATANVLPYESRYKIYIINDAEKMNPQAQNALLKTIEEPPEYVVIMLLANNPDALLETIRSRCLLVSLRTVSDRVIRDFLISEKHVSPADAAVAAAFSQGSPGRAIQVSEEEHFAEMEAFAVSLMQAAPSMRMPAVKEAAEKLAAEKDDIFDYLDLFLLWARDVLLFKATQDPEGLVFRERISDIRLQAESATYEGLEEIIESIGRARTRLLAHVSTNLVLELLFLTIGENIHG